MIVKSSENSLQSEMIHFMSVKSCEYDAGAVWLCWKERFIYWNIFHFIELFLLLLRTVIIVYTMHK